MFPSFTVVKFFLVFRNEVFFFLMMGHDVARKVMVEIRWQACRQDVSSSFAHGETFHGRGGRA